MDNKYPKIKKAEINSFGLELLACAILGLDYDAINGNYGVIESSMYEQLEIDMEMFGKIVERLLPLAARGRSPLTEKIYKGFADSQEGIWFIKITENDGK